MDHDEDKIKVDLFLSDDTLARLTTDAERAGRTVEEQIVYELRVNHGFQPADPGDTATANKARLLNRMWDGRVLTED